MTNDKAIRLLIVEDEASHAAAIERSFAKSSLATDVQIVSSLQALRQESENNPPSIALLDLNLPDGCALDLLKNPENQYNFPILIMTSQGSEAIAVETLKAGAIDYIVKSAEAFATMPKTVERLLREWQTVQQRQRAEAEADRARREWEATFDAMTDMITIHDQNMVIIRANKATHDFLQISAENLVGRICCEALWHQSQPCCGCPLVHTVKHQQTHSEVIYHQQHGKYFLVTTSPFPDQPGDRKYFIHVARDITQQQNHEQELEHLATHDALTGLANRVLLKDRFDQALHQAQRSGRIVGVLLLDLDRFKLVNDSLGHALGDELLSQVAQRLKLVVRESDTVARFGGDEFVILLTEITGTNDIRPIATKILQSIAKPYEVGTHVITLTTSLGISLAPQDGNDSTILIRNADIAMYQAKKQNNHFSYYSAEMNQQLLETLELEHDLRQALERGEFCLHYQPKVDLASGHINGCEALLRWHHPQRGMVSPGQFIPLAEETGLIVPIGTWVIKEACRQNLAWQKAGLPAISVAVNLSARQFRQGNLVEIVNSILIKTGINPALLELELTESMVMDDPDNVGWILQQLKALGVFLSLDDFGTGYSSLNYLRHFPVDSLKIDQSFIRDVAIDPSGASVVTSIIDIAHNLHLTAIAEGVETVEQLDFLLASECDLMQGYLFSKPLPADDFAQLVKNRHCLQDVTAQRIE